MSVEAFDYLETALDYIEENSVKCDEIDWKILREEIYEYARDSQSPSDTYPAIRLALSKLNDNHSQFRIPKDVDNDEEHNVPEYSFKPKGKLIENKIGYLLVPGFVGDSKAVNEYATIIQKLIVTIDFSDPCGWIIDLRHNDGGNMWPMLAGIGPILGDGQVGSFVSSDEELVGYWIYSDGQAGVDGSEISAQVTGEAYQLQAPLPPVAVLIGRRTASSGEAIVVSFIGRPNTQSFGQPTRGLVTGIELHYLEDGAAIGVASVYFADRTSQVYKDRIIPDNIIDEYASADDSDPTLTVATKWLLTQTACKISEP